jgi:hypothetical protein
MSFTVEVKKWAEQAGLDLAKAKRGAALTVFKTVIIATPVGKASEWERPESAPDGYVGGRLRGNWQATLNAPASAELDVIDAAGTLTIKLMEEIVNSAAGDDTIYLTNNVPYAYRIEFGSHSKQAPSGMVRTSILAWNNAVDEAAKK